MAVEEITVYALRCDGCKRKDAGIHEIKQRHMVTIRAVERGWLIENDKHLCPRCVRNAFDSLRYGAKVAIP